MQRAVADGELEADALRLWPYVVRKLGSHFDEYAAAAYWRNKAAKAGYTVPDQIVPLTKAWWKVGPTDSIEHWAKLAQRSQGLVQDLQRSVNQWQGQFRRDGRLDGLAQLDEIESLLNRYAGNMSPVIGFEESFQFAVLLVMKAFDAGYPQDDGDYAAWLTRVRKGLRQLDQALKWA